jgi:two-component system response regulator FixJ
MSNRPTRIFVVDDDAGVRESLEALLFSAGFETELYASAADFLDRFEPTDAACLLLDVRMPGMDGLTLLETLGAQRGGIPVVMMTAHGDVPMAVRAMRAGAADFVEKPFARDHLLDIIRRASSRAAPAVPAAQPIDPQLESRFAELTPRESEVMQRMVIGEPNKVIAHQLGISPRTVEVHRGRVMSKTGAKSLSHLVRMAIHAGLDTDT